jgi:predicted CoA-substrate-specific enzyme activase
MRSAGIDIGSRSIKLLVIDDAGRIIDSRQADSGYDPMQNAQLLLKGISYDRILATGYGRHLFEIGFDAPTVTEIKAHAAGAKALFPEVRTILDIGGQDSKAISLNPEGKIVKFEMNDRCAAGTGKFLEIMAKSLGFRIEDFGTAALDASKEVKISSMCTVFAESEITSLLAKGEDRQAIALGLHHSVAGRAAGMLRRVCIHPPVVFTGGVAKNSCMRQLLGKNLEQNILIHDEPQMIGALGAAVLAGLQNS